MNLDIESNIAEYLRRNGKVGIPGLGSFVTTNLSDTFTLENHVLSPPKGVIVFNEQGNIKDGNFAKHLAAQFDVSKSKAETALKKYGQELLNSLLNYGAVKIKNIGKLYKSADKQIKFESKNIENSAKYFHLPPIRLAPLDSTIVIKEETIKTLPKTITATTAGAAAAESSAKATTSINEAFSVDKNKITQSSSPVENQKSNIDKSEDNFIKNESVEYASNSYYEEESALKRWFWPILVVLLFLACLIFGFKYCTSYLADNRAEETENNELGSEDSNEAADNADEFNLLVANDPVLSKYADYLTPQIVQTGCIIIVGSFKKASNFNKMRQKIIDADLDPYSENYGDFTRAGIRFECADHDLIDNLKKIRKEFDRKAWYLQPELEVAY